MNKNHPPNHPTLMAQNHRDSRILEYHTARSESRVNRQTEKYVFYNNKILYKLVSRNILLARFFSYHAKQHRNRFSLLSLPPPWLQIPPGPCCQIWMATGVESRFSGNNLHLLCNKLPFCFFRRRRRQLAGCSVEEEGEFLYFCLCYKLMVLAGTALLTAVPAKNFHCKLFPAFTLSFPLCKLDIGHTSSRPWRGTRNSVSSRKNFHFHLGIAQMHRFHLQVLERT